MYEAKQGPLVPVVVEVAHSQVLPRVLKGEEVVVVHDGFEETNLLLGNGH